MLSLLLSIFFIQTVKTLAYDKALFIKNTARLNNCPCINLASQQELELLKASPDFLFLRSMVSKSSECHCSLNVVLNVKNVSHINFENPRCIWLLFTEPTVNTNSLFSGVDVPFNSAVFVIRSGITTKSAHVEELYRVAKSFPLRVRQTVVDEQNFGIVRSKTRLDMEGMKLIVGARKVLPVSYTVLDEMGSPKPFGYFVDIFKALTSMLNYQFDMIWVEEPAGALQENGSWSGLSAVLAKNEIDVLLVMYNMNSERLDIADFPMTIVRSRYQVYIRSVYSSVSLNSIFKPLAPEVWTTIGFWVIVVSSVYFACTIVRRKVHLNFEQELLGAYWEFFYFTLQTLCQQAFSEIPRAISLRIIVIVAFLTGSIIIPSYSASLVSSLTTRTPEMPFTSLEEMAKIGYRLLIAKQSADFNYITVQMGSIPKYEEILNKAITIPIPLSTNKTRVAYIDLYKYLCGEDAKIAAFGGEMEMDFAIYYSRNARLCQTTKMNLLTSSTHQGFALKKNSPYTDAFRLRLLHMRQTGILRRFSYRVKPQMTIKREMFIEVNLRDVTPIFYALLFGIVLSILLLAVELTVKQGRTHMYQNA